MDLARPGDPLLLRIGATTTHSEPPLPSSHLPTGAEIPTHETVQPDSTGAGKAECVVQQEPALATPHRSNSDGHIPAGLKRTIRSLAQAQSRAQTKGRLRLKDIGDRCSGPATDIKHKINETLGLETSLRSRLFTASVASKHPDHRERFLPTRELVTLLREDVVEKELAKCKGRQKSAIKNLLIPRWASLTGVDDSTDLKTVAQKVCGTSVSTGQQDEPTPKHYHKIFAILILIKERSMIFPFLQAELCDDDLPLALGTEEDSTSLTLKCKNKEDIRVHAFHGWGKRSLAQFVKRQWIVLAPCFSPGRGKEENPQNLLDQQILPFISWKMSKVGGFGEIYKIQIHEDYHAFNITANVMAPHPEFALKIIRTRKKGPDPKNEINILRRFQNDRHPHIISLLASYAQHDAYHLIFPWAKYDLFGYWENHDPESDNHHRKLVWLFKQCQGIAEGLSCVHRYETASIQSLLRSLSFPPRTAVPVRVEGDNKIYRLFGRHGDIKPENILWFPGDDGGVLKICDFGIAEFSTKYAVDRDRRDFIANSPTYRAPESDFPRDGSFVSPSFDIWALGCVFLEFLTWWLGGWDFVRVFNGRRLDEDSALWGRKSSNLRSDVFFSFTENQDGRSPVVKLQVTEFMKELEKHKNYNDLVREFLELIRGQMLVIVSPLDDEGNHGRVSSKRVAELLAEMQKTHFGPSLSG